MDYIEDFNGDLRSIAEVIGRDQALYLVSQCPRYKTEKRSGKGQLLLYVPKLKKLTLEHGLVRAVGYVDAQKLSTVFGGELLVLSHCTHMILEKRDEGIRTMMKSGFSIADLASYFNVTERIVLRIQNVEISKQQLSLQL
ncbi:hypothetical protein B9T25_13025 [Acinetobacter sp. ANC 4470]|uniref:Mor transcription activator family protein n=1 Tax=Acinetobacter sp. ANC 4470 TaxID=1977881 RepID=UPI000A3566DE|nr:Mor transcription activator family protein [Acinetobacter sp. ANC 4470]OTG64357.1 hypothetical protein B9T25_13025 [Acinetobacter sp. ANC 4470]